MKRSDEESCLYWQGVNGVGRYAKAIMDYQIQESEREAFEALERKLDMTAHTLAARETVEVIRESLCYLTESPAILEAHLERALQVLRYEGSHGEPLDYESIELWARLAADLAGLLQRPL